MQKYVKKEEEIASMVHSKSNGYKFDLITRLVVFSVMKDNRNKKKIVPVFFQN